MGLQILPVGLRKRMIQVDGAGVLQGLSLGLPGRGWGPGHELKWGGGELALGRSPLGSFYL